MGLTTNRKGLTLGMTGVLAAGTGAAWFTIPYKTNVAEADYAVSLDTPARAVAWADDVFVGTVVKRKGVKYTDPEGILMTVYSVRVVERLKGQVAGRVKVAQEGGDDPVRRNRQKISEAPPLEVGKTYVLATRVESRGWHAVPSNWFPVEVSGTSDPALDAWRKGVQNPEKQPRLHPSGVQMSKDNGKALYERAKDKD